MCTEKKPRQVCTKLLLVDSFREGLGMGELESKGTCILPTIFFNSLQRKSSLVLLKKLKIKWGWGRGEE